MAFFAKRQTLNSFTKPRLDVESLERRNLLSSIPILHSLPGADQTIFLDFDGHVDAGYWANARNGGLPIHSPAFDLDGDIFSLSSAEIDHIDETFEIIADKFAPFDVDVTTEEPDLALFSAGGLALRVLYSSQYDEPALGGTGNQWATPTWRGVAAFDAWNLAADTPVWVFDGSAQVGAHEVGHAFQLGHDGLRRPNGGTQEYYTGHGVGETTFIPIMGTGTGVDTYSSRWSSGIGSGADYPNSDNGLEDDVATIASALGIRSDDHGDNLAQASSFMVGSTTLGVIETRDDARLLQQPLQPLLR